ncbi:MAG: sulfatase [Candidatus Aminicenantales bacterium]
MKKNRIFFLAGVIIGFLAVSSSCKQTRESSLPNIILITVDALRADHLSTYGYPYETSPCIDAFAEKSTVFEYAYCAIPKTSASFASLMTGLHPFVHKTKPNRGILKDRFITLAEALKLRGYHTVAVVDNANLSKKYRFHQGFDRYETAWDTIQDKRESTPFITKKVLEILENPGKQPLFLWAHYVETHAPYVPPESFIEERPKGRLIKDIPLKIVVGGERVYEERPYEGEFLARYDAAVKYTDAEFGKITEVLFAEGYLKNSIIILSSDHGEELGEYNFFFDHGPLTFNSSIRVPLIVYLPGENHRRISTPVSLMDIYPTLLDKVGLSPPYRIQGKHLFERDTQRFLLIPGQVGTWSVIHRNYHFVAVSSALVNKLGLQPVYFFDLTQDPQERRNIADQRKKLQDLMAKKYIEFYEKYGDMEKAEKANEKPALSEKELKNLKSLGYIH